MHSLIFNAPSLAIGPPKPFPKTKILIESFNAKAATWQDYSIPLINSPKATGNCLKTFFKSILFYLSY